MAFKSITEVPRSHQYVKFVSFNAQTGVIRISTEMREISNKWDIQFDSETNRIRIKPSENGLQFKGNCIGCHKAFVDSLGFDKTQTNVRFNLTLADDGWYYS